MLIFMRILYILAVLSTAAYTQEYVVTTVAGGGAPPLKSMAALSLVGQVSAVAVDPAGNVYFAAENCVFKVSSTGEMTRVAGIGRPGYAGDGGAAVNAQLSVIGGLAFDPNSNLLIADSGNAVIRKVTPDGAITTVPGSAVYPGQGVTPPNSSIAVAPSGEIYISNAASDSVWKLSNAGTISRFAGNTNPDPTNLGDGGTAVLASIESPRGVAIDGLGNVYIAQGARVRRVSPTGIITTVAGTGVAGDTGDSGPATQARLSNVRAIAADLSGVLYIAELTRVRKVSLDGMINTIAGGSLTGPPGDGGPATSAVLTRASSVALAPSGDLYIADNQRLRHVFSSPGTIETIEGNGLTYTDDSGPATSSRLTDPSGVAVDTGGNVYIADNGSRIRKVSPTGTITTYAGRETPGDSGDGGPASAAQIFVGPVTGMAVNAAGDLFVADDLDLAVRKISAQGTISTIAGPGGALNILSYGLAIDGNANLYIPNANNLDILRVDSSGNITEFANRLKLGLNQPYAIATDGADNVYVSYVNAVGITKFTPGGDATQLAPSIFNDMPMTVDTVGNIYAFSPQGFVKITPDGRTAAIAGPAYQFPVDGAPALTGATMTPQALAVDKGGNVFIADSGANAVFKLSPAKGPLPPAVAAVVHSAMGLTVPLAPGLIVTLYGAGMGPSQLVTAQLNPAGLVATELGGAQILFDGKPAPLVYVSENQSAAIVPYEVSGSTVITLRYGGQTSAPMTLPVAVASPGIFTADSSGVGQAAALNQDGSLNSATRPAAIGDVVTFFGTGEGQTKPPGVDGILDSLPLPSPLLPVTLTIGGQPADVLYAGGAYGEVAGVIQINARIPQGIKTDAAVFLVLQIGDIQAPQPVSIAVH